MDYSGLLNSKPATIGRGTTNGSSNLANAAQGFSHGILQGIILRNQMDLQKQEQALKEKQAKSAAALQEQQMVNQQLQYFLNLQKEKREGVKFEHEQTMFPTQEEKARTDLAGSQADVLKKEEEISPTNILQKRRKLAAETAAAESEASTPGFEARKIFEQGLRDASETAKEDRAYKEKVKFEDYVQGHRENIKSIEDKSKQKAAAIAAVQGITKAAATGKNVIERSAVIQSQVDIAKAAGLPFNISTDETGNLSFEFTEKQGASFVKEDDIDKLPDGTQRVLPDGTIEQKVNGSWRPQRQQ
jgi:hypothetical protein